jgi:1,4-alpha-glucan branching enzyme
MVEKGRKKGTLRFSLEANGSGKVELAGDFNDWQPSRMRKNKQGRYVAVVPVPPGVYEYKFIVDGDWITDPETHTWAMNPYGTMNSVAQMD